MKIGFLLGLFGCLVLAHVAYATIQYRVVLKITGEEFSGPPVNVVVELLLGLAFASGHLCRCRETSVRFFLIPRRTD